MYTGTDSVWLWRTYNLAGVVVMQATAVSVALVCWKLAADPRLIPGWTPDWEDLLVIEFRVAAVFMLVVGLAVSGAFLLWAYQGYTP